MGVKTLEVLWSEIEQRKPNDPGSTGQLLALGIHQIGKKVVEEAAEAWMAAEYETGPQTAEEISQLFYHLLVLAKAKGISLNDIYEVL
jgi:phosphoribosyl-ATP pyrophosphohydrolase